MSRRRAEVVFELRCEYDPDLIASATAGNGISSVIAELIRQASEQGLRFEIKRIDKPVLLTPSTKA